MNFLRQPVLRLGQYRILQPTAPGATVVRHRPGLDFSGTGLMYCCMMVFMGVAALNSQANLLFGVFGLMIGVLLVSGIISRAVLRRVAVRRVLPAHGVVGQPMRITYEVTNTKRVWPSLSVTLIELNGVQGFLAQPQCYLLHAAPGMTARIPVEAIAKRRGLYEFDHYQLATSFPFGFIKRAVSGRQKDIIEIYPALAKVDRRLLTLCRSADTSGAPMRPRPGGADEFYGVKEHRPGDNPRWIYWRRSAHTNKLVSKQMTEVAPPRLLLLVDTSLPDPAKLHGTATQQTVVERTIAMAASLAAAALDDGLSVGLCAYASGQWKAIPPKGGKNQRSDLLSVLARLPSGTTQPTTALLEACHSLLKTGTTAVLLTPHDLQVGLLERARGGMVVISAMHASADAWFHFEPAIDFSRTAPLADQIVVPGSTSSAAEVADPDLSAPASPAIEPAPIAAGARHMNMYDVKQFRSAFYVLLLLGMSAYALAVESPAIFAFGCGAIAFNWWLIHEGRFRPLPRWAANVVTIIALLYTFKEFFAPGAVVVLVIGNFLVLLQLVKLWEQRANRDLAQLLVLSLLLMVAGSINTASLLFGIMLIVYLFLSLYCCLLLHLKVEAEFAKAAAGIPDANVSPAVIRQDQRFLTRSMRRLTGLVSVFAVVCAVLVFVFFPRGPGANFIGPMSFQPEQTLTGFDDHMSFESVAKITQNPQIIAHVQVWKDNAPINGGQLLLRGVALDQYDPTDAQWSRSITWEQRAIAERDNVRDITYQFAPILGPRWRQVISLEPTGTPVMFALAGPERTTVYRTLHVDMCGSDESLSASDRLTEPLTYEVISSNSLSQVYPRDPPLSPDPLSDDFPPLGPVPTESDRAAEVGAFLRQWQRGHNPTLIDSRIHDLAMRPEVSGANALGSLAAQRAAAEPDHVDPLDDQIASNIQDYLRTHYQYTLDLTDFAKVRGKDRIVAFLYDLKRGHCEYFAGSMALMCQSLGLHARVVVGFRSDEFNSYTGSFIVRESDAHAWVEVLTQEGWKTFDPTSEDMANGQTRTASLMASARHFIDFLEYTYATAVITYDNNDRANIIQAAETKMYAASTRGQNSWNWLRVEWDEFFKFRKYDLVFSNILAGVVGLMIVAGLGFMIYFLWEKWMLRRRVRRMGIASLPVAEQERLARQLGFYDELVRLLERLGIRRPKHQTPLEFSDSLLFLPSEAYRTIGRLTQVFYRVRFGQAELSPAQQRRLHNVLNNLAADLGQSIKPTGGATSSPSP